MTDVAGVDEAVEEISEVVEFLQTPEKFTRIGGRIPKGGTARGASGDGEDTLSSGHCR